MSCNISPFYLSFRLMVLLGSKPYQIEYNDYICRSDVMRVRKPRYSTTLVLIKTKHQVNQDIFSFLLNSVFVAANKPNEKNGSNMYAPDYPPLNSRVKDKTSFEFLFYVRFDSVNYCTVCQFYETSITIFPKPHPPLLLIYCQNFHADSLKPIL